MLPEKVIQRNRRFKSAEMIPVGFARISGRRLSPASLYTHVMQYCDSCKPRCRGHRKGKVT